ncbi:MAG: hypothetical protein ACX939_08560, partial [Hyphococcus sp.]
IGRRFVPKGTLAGAWNLIVKSCRACNSEKSDLEDETSAITFYPNVIGAFDSHDENVIAHVKRKMAKSYSRRTGKPIGASAETLTIDGEFMPGVTMTAKLSAPPQLDPDRLHRLLDLHVKAFFYLSTYKEGEQKGYFATGVFSPVNEAIKTDWGNSHQLHFTKITKSWPFRFHGVTAQGYFKYVSRRAPDADAWSYAVEYNKNLRAIGFFGDKEYLESLGKSFPDLGFGPWVESGDEFYRRRRERQIEESEDILFDSPTI